MMLKRNTPWLMGGRHPACEMRLYCFPYAGGSASAYLPWQEELAPQIEVCGIQLPGRGARLTEPPLTSISVAVEQIGQAIIADRASRFAFFGHSLGALLAYEVARYLASRGAPTPAHLIVSGSEAPRYRKPSKALHRLDDGELIAALRTYNGTPAETLANTELMKLVLPAVRADFSMAHGYTYRPDKALLIPLTVLAGTSDGAGREGAIVQWLEESEYGGQVHWIEGDHFFIHSQRDATLGCIRQVLSETPRDAGAARECLASRRV